MSTQQEPSTNPPETIPIHVSVFINAILNNKRSFLLEGDEPTQHEVVKIGVELAKIIAHFDREGKYCYLQSPDCPHNDAKCWRLWNKQAWQNSYERYQKQKIESEKHRQLSLLREEKILELADALEREGMALEREHAVLQARYFVMKGKVQHATFFGVDISELGISQEKVSIIE